MVTINMFFPRKSVEKCIKDGRKSVKRIGKSSENEVFQVKRVNLKSDFRFTHSPNPHEIRTELPRFPQEFRF